MRSFRNISIQLQRSIASVILWLFIHRLYDKGYYVATNTLTQMRAVLVSKAGISVYYD